MKLQTKASFRKEFLAFSRTYKLLAVTLSIIGLAVVNPLLITGLRLLMEGLSDVYKGFGMDVSQLTEALGSSVSTGVAQAIMDLTQTGLIIFLIVINSNAGGEQKKRSTMIPSSSGLRSFSYVFPKFIIYPLTAFVIAIVAAFASWGASSMVFDNNDVSIQGVLLGGVLAGVCMMFYVCAHLTIGTATGKAGMSAAICIVASLLLPSIFNILDFGVMFNPFTLNILANAAVHDPTMTAARATVVCVTVIIAFVLMVALFFLAWFVQNARKIDNSGNEVEI